MRILACVKRVPAPGARILLTPDGRDVDTTNLAFAMSPHEECAIEEAVQLIEIHGGDTTVLTVGPPESEAQLRTAVSVGVDNAVLVTTDGSDWDPMQTADAIVETVRSIEEDDGVFDLLLFGNESADSGGYQVGMRVAHGLSRPMVNGARALEIAGAVVTVKRPAGEELEVYELPMPAVVGVREGINLPRYPTLRGRLASRNVKIGERSASAVPGTQAMVRLIEPTEETGATTALGQGVDAASNVVDVLEELGVV